MLGLAELVRVAANSTSLALVASATALVVILVWSQRRPRKNFPPGPTGWPLVGSMLDFWGDKAPHIIFVELAKKYGDVFSVRVGQRWMVVLNGAEMIKEAFLKKGVEFANRPNSYSFDLITEGGKDIALAQFTPTWKIHRKLVASAFRTLATGNNERFEKLVYSILPGLTKYLEERGSEPFNSKTMLHPCFYSIIATICFGKQYEFNGPEIKYWMETREEGREILGSGLAADYVPVMKYFPTPSLKKLKKVINNYHDALNKELEEHRASYDGVSEPKDLIEILFQARQEMEDEGSEDVQMITETHIRQTIADVFAGGSDSSIFTLHWSIGLLVQYPEVQAKVAAELDKIVGKDRLPCLNDRDNLPYTVATLYEVMRYSSITPTASPHATSKDVQIGGYTIPEGTWVLANIYSMHYDEKLWDEPHKFKPEHFLDEAGEVRTHPEGFLPFSTGRRVCVGESVAKAELFLLFSWLFQHFRFLKAPGMEGKDYSESLAKSFMILLKEKDVVVEKRI